MRPGALRDLLQLDHEPLKTALRTQQKPTIWVAQRDAAIWVRILPRVGTGPPGCLRADEQICLRCLKSSPQRLVWEVLHRLVAGYIVFAAIPQILSGIDLMKDDLQPQFYGAYGASLGVALLLFVGGIALSKRAAGLGSKSERGTKTAPGDGVHPSMQSTAC